MIRAGFKKMSSRPDWFKALATTPVLGKSSRARLAIDGKSTRGRQGAEPSMVEDEEARPWAGEVCLLLSAN